MQYLLALRTIARAIIFVLHMVSAFRRRINGNMDEAVFRAKMKSYEEIRGMLDTGDLVLFSGRGFVSWLIRWASGSKWSHIGMVVKVTDGDMILLFESTTLSKVKDVVSGKVRRGVQLVSLSERIMSYDGQVGIVFLAAPRTSEMIKALLDFRGEVRNRPYEKSFVGLFKSLYDGCFGENKEDLTSVFCSELVAEAYQRMGVLSNEIPSDEYTPADFDIDTNKNAHKLPFINGCSLTPVVPLLNKKGTVANA